MARKIGRAWLLDSQRGCLLYLGATAVTLPLVFCLTVAPGWVVANGPPLSDLAAVLVVVIPALLLVALISGSGLALAGYTLYNRAAWLDGIVAPLGLEGRPYLLSGRQYQGVYRERPLDVLFYRGPTFTVQVGTAVPTRLAVAASSATVPALAKLFGRVPLSLDDPALDGLTLFAHDETWARRFVANPQVAAMLPRLVNNPSGFLFQQLHLAPGLIYLYLFRNKGLFANQLGPEMVEAWADDLVHLAEIAESLPAPQEQLEASRLQQLARSDRFSPQRPLLLIGLLFFSGIFCALMVIVGTFLLVD